MYLETTWDSSHEIEGMDLLVKSTQPYVLTDLVWDACPTSNCHVTG